MGNIPRKIKITHLYPKEMNLYGDIGNITCLSKRAEWRGMTVEVNAINCGDTLKPGRTDLYFFGGGQDLDQMNVYRFLLENKSPLIEDLEEGVPMLAVCGGYQLLGEYFLDSSGREIEGIGFLPTQTVAPSKDMKSRAVGNIITRIVENSPLLGHSSGLNTLVGFENHSGRTRFNSNSEIIPLGKVVIGFGDNEDQVSDGAIYRNVIGTYMHGSVLPKNPHLADYLLSKALENAYDDQQLSPLADSEEINAHKYILKRYGVA